ncbi:TonB-dependent receptor [Pseudoalteromonas sp. OOF1S-7]|uniref:TonB-dependent receptor n=1 Tax=Pseudoalteromonas sp. OOF1S-7 TaxID=2917757 RepID=UPI001EF48FDB|nr:TonB-dependent receptor [Pseudoalteromonas sp. OOF1S-7]MCG7534028.1 TonB-dependent receptor [Pseudoalteromonas sp. OOF1S-7]
MKTQLRKTALSLAVIAGIGASGAAFANETSSSVKGQIVGPNGNPAVGTTITIMHLPTGSTKVTSVNDAGYFSAKGLRVGGPYQIIVDSNKYEDQLLENVYLSLGSEYPVNVQLQPQSSMEQIVVTGRPISQMSGGTGPAATFTLENLQEAPAINRDLKDIVRADPRVYVDESRGAIQCGGGHPRFNSLTLDGVRMNDNFGLSSNGYPTVRAPFSFDSIEQVAVELAPFDVQYGGFTSCNINAVTKTGSNEIHGGVFYDYTNDSMKGDKAEDRDVDPGEYTEKRYGFNVGLPILKDQLFLFTSYEKLEGVEQFQYSALGATVTQDDINKITQIAKDKYGYNAGGMIPSMPVEDEKLLVKLDWNINDSHRANLVYNYNDGFRLDQSDQASDELPLDSHYYEQGAEFTSVVASIYSDWNDDFSTEIRVGKSDLDARQKSLDAASGFGEFQVETVGGGTVYFGPDDSRQANDLDWDNFTLKLAGTYYLDQHTITAGYEYEDLNVFNLFVQHTQGEFRFKSIEDLEAGNANRIYYNNAAGTNNQNDVAASFSYQQHTFYIQDEYSFTDIDATLTFGLRYDKYTSDDQPTMNDAYQTRYGFANTKNMDGIDLLQPRVGFNWYVDDALEVRGGIGLYSGGNPNVWVSNSYSNDGVTQVGAFRSPFDLFANPMTNFDGGTPGFDVPQEMFDEIGNKAVGAGDGSVNAIAPNFELPSEWKLALGATYTTEDEYVFSVDWLFTDKQNSALIKDIGLTPSDKTTFDGRPVLEAHNPNDSRSGEYLLTNVSGPDGEAQTLSFSVAKRYDNGIDFTLSYAYTDSKDVNPMTSSTAGSNYGNLATSNPWNPGLATSDYEVPHRFTLQFGYKHEFVDGYATKFNLFGQASEGQPYSFLFSGSDRNWGDSSWNRNGRQLMYVPLENDPNVEYDMTPDELKEFNDFIAAEGLERGSIVGRNSANADWFVKFDFKVTQELPGFMDGHKGEVFFVIDNLTNLLNSDWGTMRKGKFVGNNVVKAALVDGKYVFSDFNKDLVAPSIEEDVSVWEMRVGVKYTF